MLAVLSSCLLACTCKAPVTEEEVVRVTLLVGSGSKEASLQIACAGASVKPSSLPSCWPSPLALRPAP